MKRKVFALVLAMCLLLGLSVSASAASANEARNSVVVVSTLLETDAGAIGFGHGSGFFVADRYLVTNYHVIEDFEKYGAGERVSITVDNVTVGGRSKVRVYYDSKDYEEAFVVGFDSIRDVALLRLDNATEKRTPLQLKAPTQDMVGATVFAVGYPGLADNALTDSTSSWGKNDASVTSGSISRLVTQSGTGQRNVQIDCDIKHGNSGGPVVDETGAVIGIATWSVSNSSNESVNYAVNIEDAMMLMDQYRVPYTVAGSAAPSGGETVEQPVIIQDQPVVEKKDSNLGLIIGIVVAVVAVAVCAVVIVVVLGKNKTRNDQVSPPPHVEPRKVPTVRSFAQANYGTHIAVSTQPVLIGRSSACGLRFPADTPGVSGSHCTIQWDEGGKCFVVMDLNSTYGTFLSTGQKMTPNKPYRLCAGDRISLGDQKNILALELE